MDLSFNQNYYTHASFINELRKQEVKNFSLLYYYVNLEYYKTIEDLLSIFINKYNVIENYGDIYKISIIEDDKEDSEKIIIYLYFDKKNSIIIIYTLATSEQINALINRRIKRAYGTYHIPINFTAFMKLTSYLTKNYSKIKIPFFVSIHYPTFRTKGIHRKDVRRTINYWGEDGLESMNELKKYYGMLPKVIEYKIENFGTYLITNNGKFTLESMDDMHLSWELFFKIVDYVIKDMLTYKKIISKSEYKIIPYETENKVFNLPTATPWIVKFSNSLDDKYLEELIKTITDKNFNLFNKNTFSGNSFTFSSAVYDEEKNNLFSIDVDNNKITVIPYERNILESFLKLYEAISEFDPDSNLVEINNE